MDIVLKDTLLKKFLVLLLGSLVLYFLISLANPNSQSNVLTISKALGVGGTGPEFTPTPTSTESATPTPTVIPTSAPTLTPTPTPDILPPAVSITNPANGATVKKNTTVTITASASDNVAVSNVEFYVNGSLQCVDATSPYNCSWLVPNRPRVNYILTATAVDTSGNTGSHTVTVTSK